MKVSFVIPGPPKGKGRPRFSNAGPYVSTYTPQDTKNYEELVRMVYMAQCRNYKFSDNAQLDIRIFAYFPIPKSTTKQRAREMEAQILRPAIKSDWDNIGKIICDACNGIAYHDDKQIVDAQVRKFYSHKPRVQVIIQDAQPITGPVE